MAFRSTKAATVMSKIPDGVSTEALLGKLHNHKIIIEASPYALGSEPVDCPADLEKTKKEADSTQKEDALPDAQWICYLIREKIPYYGAISFHACLKDFPLGHDQVVHAPQGLVMKSTSRIVTRDDGSRFLEDNTIFSVNRLMMPFVVKSWEKAHYDLHATMFSEIERGDVTNGQTEKTPKPTLEQRPSWFQRRLSSFKERQRTTV